MRALRTLLPILLGVALTFGIAITASAEQKQRIGAYDAHYSLVPTLFLKPEIAKRHGISRGRDRALLNVSILDGSNTPVQAAVAGHVKNLLGQETKLAFREVLDGTAVYYLAVVQHTDREILRFFIDIVTPDSATHRLDLTQKMYWEGR
jgi:hypothetical protein